MSNHTTSSTAEMDDKTISDKTEMEDAECKYSIRIPTPKTCEDVDIFDEEVIMDKILNLLKKEESFLEEDMKHLTEVYSAISERSFGIREPKGSILEEIMQLVET